MPFLQFPGHYGPTTDMSRQIPVEPFASSRSDVLNISICKNESNLNLFGFHKTTGLSTYHR